MRPLLEPPSSRPCPPLPQHQRSRLLLPSPDAAQLLGSFPASSARATTLESAPVPGRAVGSSAATAAPHTRSSQPASRPYPAIARRISIPSLDYRNIPF